MVWIKKHWKEVLIGLLIIFSLNKCTVACNRDTKINKQNIEIVQKDSIIKSQSDSLNILNVRFEENQKGQDRFDNYAIGEKQDLIKEISELKNKNSKLESQIKSQTNEINRLKKENQSLKNK